jgi:hypothetical protein
VDSTNYIIKKDMRVVLNEIQTWKFLLLNVPSFDIIHYNFGSSIIPAKKIYDPLNPSLEKVFSAIYELYYYTFSLKELAWLKRLGKKIFVTYQGDDARIGSFVRNHWDVFDRGQISRLLEIEKYTKRKIKYFDRYADRIYALNPDLLHTLPKRAEFLPYASVDIENWNYVGVNTSNPIKILHAPRKRDSKGTKYVLESVSRLKNEGHNIELILIENVRHDEVKGLYAQADILVDQLLTGWYGGLALELMFLGKPVLCYIREQDLKFVPKQMRDDLPIINVNPHNLYDVLKEFVTVKQHLLPEIGRKSRLYAEKWHDPRKIAEKMKRDYEEAFYSVK